MRRERLLALALAVLLGSAASGCSAIRWVGGVASDIVDRHAEICVENPAACGQATPTPTPTPPPEPEATPTPAPVERPPAPDWFTATPGVEQIALEWTSSTECVELRREGEVLDGAERVCASEYLDQHILGQHCYAARALGADGQLSEPARACATAKSALMPEGEPTRITRIDYLRSGVHQDVCSRGGPSCVQAGGVMRIWLHVDVPLPERIDFWSRAWTSTWDVCGSTLVGQRGINPKNVVATQGPRVTVGCSDYRAEGGLSVLLSPPPSAPSGGCRWTFKLPATEDGPELTAEGVVDILAHDRPMPGYQAPQGCN